MRFGHIWPWTNVGLLVGALAAGAGCKKTPEAEPAAKPMAETPPKHTGKADTETSTTSLRVRGPRMRDRLPVPADFVEEAKATINKSNYRSVLEGLERDYATE